MLTKPDFPKTIIEAVSVLIVRNDNISTLQGNLATPYKVKYSRIAWPKISLCEVNTVMFILCISFIKKLYENKMLLN